jgi:hypothetical protein
MKEYFQQKEKKKQRRKEVDRDAVDDREFRKRHTTYSREH